MPIELDFTVILAVLQRLSRGSCSAYELSRARALKNRRTLAKWLDFLKQNGIVEIKTENYRSGGPAKTSSIVSLSPMGRGLHLEFERPIKHLRALCPPQESKPPPDTRSETHALLRSISSETDAVMQAVKDEGLYSPDKDFGFQKLADTMDDGLSSGRKRLN